MSELLTLLRSGRAGGEHPALVHRDAVVGHGELWTLVARTAATLREAGLAPGGRVIVLLPKSVDYVVTMLAALECGAAYVPLDHALPAERLRLIGAGCRPQVVVTDARRVADVLEAGPAAVVLAEGPGDLRVARPPVGPVAAPAQAATAPAGADTGDLAYIIYTSGSTGLPKGVMIPRRAVAHFLRNVLDLGLYDGTTRFLNVCPLHFDASVLDVLGTLCHGGTVVLMDPLRLPRQVPDAVARHRVTDTLLVPSVMNLVAHHCAPVLADRMSTLRTLWFGGEASSVPIVRRYVELLPHVRYVHGYGPTESTHSATVHELTGPPGDVLPIGRPLPGVELHVVGEDGEPVPDGVPGELWIGGAQLMLGYCDDPEQTRRVLVPDRFTGRGSLYRSGDVVVRDASGSYTFVTRQDAMLKIAGNLVYPAEIERAVASLPGVDQCVVFDVPGPAGVHLVAVVVSADPAVTPAEVRREVLRRLPRYMLPDVVRVLAPAPHLLTPAGKVDRQKLVTHVQAGR